MKCEKVKQHIDQYFMEGFMELDPDTGLHIERCQDCQMYFKSHKKAKYLITNLHDFEPVLIDPEGLTEDIMEAVGNSTTHLDTIDKVKPANIFQNVIFRRLLSAAAIILFALFGFEQYLVLDKINRLETQYQNISGNRFSGDDGRIYRSWETRTLRNFNQLKTNNRELFKKISTINNNILLSEITSDKDWKLNSETKDFYRELYKHKESSSLLHIYIAKRMLLLKKM